MLGHLPAVLRRRIGRPAALLAVVLGLLAQSVALPWHLASGHHGSHDVHGAVEHAGGHAHEHPDLPTDHDEDDHEFSSMLISGQARERLAAADAPAPPLHVLAEPDAGAAIATRGVRATLRGCCGGTPQGPPEGAFGARGPPSADRPELLPSR